MTKRSQSAEAKASALLNRAQKKASAKPPSPAVRRSRSASTAQAAKTAPPAAARTDGLRSGSKMAAMLDMVLRPEGATEAEICADIGWKTCRVTLKRTCEKVGAVLKQSRGEDGGKFVYKAKMRKGT